MKIRKFPIDAKRFIGEPSTRSAACMVGSSPRRCILSAQKTHCSPVFVVSGFQNIYTTSRTRERKRERESKRAGRVDFIDLDASALEASAWLELVSTPNPGPVPVPD